MKNIQLVIAAMIIALGASAYAGDDSSAKEHAEKAERHDRAGDKANSEGRKGEAVREYSDRNRERDKAVEKMMNPKEKKKDD